MCMHATAGSAYETLTQAFVMCVHSATPSQLPSLYQTVAMVTFNLIKQLWSGPASTKACMHATARSAYETLRQAFVMCVHSAAPYQLLLLTQTAAMGTFNLIKQLWRGPARTTICMHATAGSTYETLTQAFVMCVHSATPVSAAVACSISSHGHILYESAALEWSGSNQSMHACHRW